MRKAIYFFAEGQADGSRGDRNLLGGKGAGLAEMARLGLPVPPGFTITTEACLRFFDADQDYLAALKDQVLGGIERLEQVTGKSFGTGPDPLLVSVRSGARSSMPGMMDTVLNVGLTNEAMAALTAKTGDGRFALDCQRRLIQMYAGVVLGASHEAFERVLEEAREEARVERDIELSPAQLSGVVDRFREVVRNETGQEFPEDPRHQLWSTIEAVFRSWTNPRAQSYRRIHRIPHSWGTAANVQAMVFGNLGPTSATGVAFTRDPSTGAKQFMGEYLLCAQGEDVVAGIRTPQPIASLEGVMPGAYSQLSAIYSRLEQHYRDMQDIEFTIEEGRLWVLQTRSGKRTGVAQVRIAVDMVDEGLIDEETAIGRIEPEALTQLLAPVFDSRAKDEALATGRLLTRGLNAGPGAACGRVVFSPEKAVDMVHNKRERVILVRTETSPEDIEGMSIAEGIVTARGGMTSHAAVVARGMGKPCVVGAHGLAIDYDKKLFRAGGTTVELGEWISIDGTTGEILRGQIPTRPSEIVQVRIDRTLKAEDSPLHARFERVMAWADRHRRLGVRTNADSPEDAWAALALGAEGIGLCRTEHMFFHADRIRAVREMIIAESPAEREAALAKVQPFQRKDFAEIFRVMKGLPVTIRLLDPPLHEFLPNDPSLLMELANVKGVSVERIRERVEALHESNPMLGHRGCRLAITYPEIYDMQVRAVFEACVEVLAEGVAVRPEIMVPIVGVELELRLIKERILRIGKEFLERRNQALSFQVGTMIEIPRAAFVAGELGRDAQFFSFGTNDLTQLTYGYSRDDAEGSFLRFYIEHGVLPHDPFQTIDPDGVGELVRIATRAGREANPELKVGICGEHGGDPVSIRFFHDVGLDYVSCSPRRVPVARLAAAQAALARQSGEASGEV